MVAILSRPQYGKAPVEFYTYVNMRETEENNG